MNNENQHRRTSDREMETPQNFFRDVEIEFLIHELKDPLSIIETGLRTLLERQDKYGSLAPRQEKTLQRTLRNSRKARQMLNNLLEIGRSESGCFFSCRFQPAESAYQALKQLPEAFSRILEIVTMRTRPGKFYLKPEFSWRLNLRSP